MRDYAHKVTTENIRDSSLRQIWNLPEINSASVSGSKNMERNRE